VIRKGRVHGAKMEWSGMVIRAMIEYFGSDIRRISHFLKVFGFAKSIADSENISAKELAIIEIAALTHDIGIKVSEEKYKSASGTYQQIEGPPVAGKLLEGLKIPKEIIDRVCWLIAHHHTYDAISEIDHQILVEADFLVNIQEDGLEEKEIRSIKNKIFKTGTGISILNKIYLCGN